jgi:hypothetical protein
VVCSDENRLPYLQARNAIVSSGACHSDASQKHQRHRLAC